MVKIPPWVVFLVAAWVIIFGVYRLHVARQRRKPVDPGRPNFRQTGFYMQSPLRHTVFGLVYLVMGGLLVAMGFGVQLPIQGGCSGEAARQADEAPPHSIEAKPTP